MLKKLQIKSFLKIIIISLILSLLIAPLRGGYIEIGTITGFKLSSIVGFVVYFHLTIYFLGKIRLSNGLIIISVFIGISFFILPLYIISFSGAQASHLEYLIHISSIILGWIFYSVNSKLYKVLIFIFSMTLCFWTSTTGYDLWLHKLNSGTFTGELNNQIIYDNFPIQSDMGDTIALRDFKGKYLLLDCWYTRCGYCYEEMPKVQELYDTYKNNSEINIYTLHSRTPDETFSSGVEILNKKGYNLPTLSIFIDDPKLKELGIKTYPGVLIFDKESRLVFRGNIDTAAKYLERKFEE
jgi:thiol-disulfide isomerase/thioredoxin